MADLYGLHLLITRPKDLAQRSATLFEQAGATVTCHPFLSIQPLSDVDSRRAIKNRVLALDEYQHAIFVSQNAVRYGGDWIDQFWPQLPQDLQFYAIGEATAHVLQQVLSQLDAVVNVPSQAMNSEALLELPPLQHLEGSKVLIFRGRGGRTYLGTVLEQRGATIDYCELYQRQIPDTINLPLLHGFRRDQRVPMVAVLSVETLDNLCASLRVEDPQLLAWLKKQVVVVPGQRVEQRAKALHFLRVVVAENATDDGILGAINDWRSTQR